MTRPTQRGMFLDSKVHGLDRAVGRAFRAENASNAIDITFGKA
jgi:hypothetical protein